MRRVWFAVGGTGGHVLPALKLAKTLPSDEIRFIGVGLKSNAYFSGKYPYKNVTGGALRSKNPLSLIKSVFCLLRGICESLNEMRKYKPDLVVGFGSFHSFPVLFAAKLKNIPYILYETNSVPGKVIKFFAKKAEFTAVQFESCKAFLKGKVIAATHMDEQPTPSQKEAREYFGLSPDKKTLLIFGGSQGAQKINEAAAEAFERSDFQIIHIVGINSEGVDYRTPCCVKSFEDRMDLAWMAATLAICRSGASTIAEHVRFKVPCIFIPYPYATDDHQMLNALFASKVIKGSKILLQDKLTPDLLRQLVNESLFDLESMKIAIDLYKNQTNKEILSVLIQKHLSMHV